VKTGVQIVCNCLKGLDSGFRRNDGKRYFSTFYDAIKFDRTPFYIRMAELENELKKEAGITQKLKMTIAEMLTQGLRDQNQ